MTGPNPVISRLGEPLHLSKMFSFFISLSVFLFFASFINIIFSVFSSVRITSLGLTLCCFNFCFFSSSSSSFYSFFLFSKNAHCEFILFFYVFFSFLWSVQGAGEHTICK